MSHYQPPKADLFIILGQTNAGKTTLVKELTKKYPKLSQIITTTDRPPRPGEKNGVDYWFKTPEELRHLELLAPRTYHVADHRTWTYGINPAHLHNNGIIIVDYPGFKDLDHLLIGRYNLHSYYLDIPYDVRWKRSNHRHDEPKERQRRFAADDKAFKNVPNDNRILDCPSAGDIKANILHVLKHQQNQY